MKRFSMWLFVVVALSFVSLAQGREVTLEGEVLDQHCYLGIEKVRLHIGLSLLTYTATMLGRLLEDDYAGMREMKVEMPVANWTARAA